MTKTEIILLIMTSFTFLTIKTIFTILGFYKLRDICKSINKDK